jgi:ABC-type lipoprotein export system ATPase subunit
VLKKINARFAAGQVSFITGVIGAGKSTLLHLMAGLMRPTSGNVLIDGETVSRWCNAHRDRWRRNAGIVFQRPYLIDDLTVLENVILPLVPIGIDRNTCRRRANNWLERLGIDHLASANINVLSGGERQKVSIARALINQPIFVFADEPTAHQDESNAMMILKELTHCAIEQATVIIAAHDQRVCDYTSAENQYRLEQGKLRPSGDED